MANKTYVIDYIITLAGGMVETHTTKVKNCMGEMHAKVKLDEYLRRKHPDFVSVSMTRVTDDMMSMFGEMFGGGGDNPFSDLLSGFGKK